MIIFHKFDGYNVFFSKSKKPNKIREYYFKIFMINYKNDIVFWDDFSLSVHTKRVII